jgi:hypothetical protein
VCLHDLLDEIGGAIDALEEVLSEAAPAAETATMKARFSARLAVLVGIGFLLNRAAAGPPDAYLMLSVRQA